MNWRNYGIIVRIVRNVRQSLERCVLMCFLLDCGCMRIVFLRVGTVVSCTFCLRLPRRDYQLQSPSGSRWGFGRPVSVHHLTTTACVVAGGASAFLITNLRTKKSSRFLQSKTIKIGFLIGEFSFNFFYKLVAF